MIVTCVVNPSGPSDKSVMSVRAKAFFGFSVASAAVVIPWVHYMQDQQRDALHDGPVRDAERRSKKAVQRELTQEQLERAAEYEEQKRLRAEYSQTQQVSDRQP